MKLRYLTFALGVHAGAIAFAFAHGSVRELHTPGVTTLQSRLRVQDAETTVSERRAETVDMPEVAAVPEVDAVAPESLILPAPKPRPEGPLPQRLVDWPEADLPGRPPSGSVRLVKPVEKPAPETPGAEAVESPVANEPKSSKPPRAADVPGAETPPRLLAPKWPEEIRRSFAGRVLVAVVVSPAGQAVSVEIIEGTGNRQWDALLEETFRFTPYAPGLTDGIPVICSHRFRVTFRRR